jgi:dephospho-CoA kinase
MQKAKVMAAADYTIMNDSSLKELGKQIEEFYHLQQ